MEDKILKFFQSLDPNAPINVNSQSFLDFQHFNKTKLEFKNGCLVVNKVCFFTTQKMQDILNWINLN